MKAYELLNDKFTDSCYNRCSHPVPAAVPLKEETEIVIGFLKGVSYADKGNIASVSGTDSRRNKDFSGKIGGSGFA